MIDALAKAGEQADAVFALLREWREPIIFLVLFAEGLPILGIIAPGLIVLVLAGFLGGVASGLEAAGLALTAWTALYLSNLLSFLLGKEGARRSQFVRRIIGDKGAFGQALAAQPVPILILYQFPPYSRTFAPLLLGACAFSARRWLLLSASGTLLFVAVFFGMGFAAARLGGGTLGATTWAGGISAVFMVGFFIWLASLLTRVFKRRAGGTS
jgi:membrane protein DedA with SNARE-associated domain